MEWMEITTELDYWQSLGNFALCMWVWALERRVDRLRR